MFRSKVLPDHGVTGYQVDKSLDTDWLVRLYDEWARHTLARRGQRTSIGTDSTMGSTMISQARGPAPFKLEAWQQCHLNCQSTDLPLKVNGETVAEMIDGDLGDLDLSGILALQLHSGPRKTVPFKDIRLKRL